MPGIVPLDWIVLDPPPFLGALQGLQSPEARQEPRERLFGMRPRGQDIPAPTACVRGDMGPCGAGMWARAGREIAAAYARFGNLLKPLAAPDPPPVLRPHAQPRDEDWLAARRDFAAARPWLRVGRLEARSRFPMFEVPGETAAAIGGFAGGRAAPAGRDLTRAAARRCTSPPPAARRRCAAPADARAGRGRRRSGGGSGAGARSTSRR